MRNIFVFILLSFSITSFAQVQGLNPSNINWQILKTPSINVVYAEGMESQAQRIANMVNYMDENNRLSVGDKKRKLDMILQNRTVIPNGYVAMGPFRSEFFATPPQSTNLLGSMNWLDVLTIHEYRHAHQMMNMRRGISKIAWVLAGDQGQTIVNVLAIPNWFYEGDAVVSETALTESGRGRTPDFTAGQRAMVQDEIDYRYMKWRNGSFKDVVPDHYRLGYMMLTHLRNEYGNELSKEIMQEGASWKKIVYPYSRSMKKRTGLHTWQMYRESWEKNKARWKTDMDALSLTPSTKLTESRRTVTNYYFPQFDNKKGFYVVKESFKETSAIIQISEDGKESKIVEIGVNIDNYFDQKEGVLAWTEFSTAGRRSNESFSNLLVFKDGEKHQITKKGKYFSPVIIDQKRLLAIEISALQQPSFHVVDIEDGAILEAIELPANIFILRPTMISDNGFAYIQKENSQLSIQLMDLETKRAKTIFGPTNHAIDGLEFRDGSLFFTSSLSGIDNIYSVDLDGQNLTKLTSVAVAATDPDISADGKSLIYVERNSRGSHVSTSLLSNNRESDFTFLEPIQMQWQDKVAAEAEGGNILDKIPTTKYESRKYGGLMRGMRLHSWNLGGNTTIPTVKVNVNNALDDASISGTVGFNRNENKPFAEANLRIAKYFPIFDFAIGNTSRRFSTVIDTTLTRVDYNESYGQVSVTVPYNKLKGNYNTSAAIRVSGEYKNQSGFSEDIEPKYGFSDRGLIIGSVSANYAILRRRAVQNLRSRFGFESGITMQYQLLDDLETAVTLTAGVYLPGLAKNHSLYLSGGHRIFGQSDALIPFTNDFIYVRSAALSNNTKTGSRVSFDYAFPLAYPDWGFAGLLYFKRLKMNIFADLGFVQPLTINEGSGRTAFGTEIISEQTILNLLPIPVGIQVGMISNVGLEGGYTPFYNFILSSNF